MKESINYQELYGNVIMDGFIDSLQLGEHAKDVIKLLFEQRDGINPMYVPELQIEGLVTDDTSPYKAVRVLHELKEKRIVIYGIAERIPRDSEHSMGMEDLILTPLVNKAKEQGLIKEPEKPDESEVIVTNYDFRRVAIFNLEYPVVYYCLKEEAELTEVGDSVLPDLYDAISEDRLAEELIEKDYPVILEFLNYVQSLFQQPLTEIVSEQEETHDSTSESEGETSGRRLVTGVEPDRTGSEIPEGPVHDQQMAESAGVEGDDRGQGESEKEVKSYFIDQIPLGCDEDNSV